MFDLLQLDSFVRFKPPVTLLHQQYTVKVHLMHLLLVHSLIKI